MTGPGVTTRIGRRVLMLPCDCSAEEDYVRLSFWVEPFEDIPLLTVSVMAPRRSGWGERLKMVWEILRGRSPWFSSIVLDRPGVVQASEFLQEWVERYSPDDPDSGEVFRAL